MSELQVLESPREQASDETIIWDFDWTERLAGQEIANAAGRVVQVNSGEDETATCLAATPSVNGAHISLTVHALTVGKRYRVTARATLSGGSVQDADLLLEVPH
jgi:hypothetical protein